MIFGACNSFAAIFLLARGYTNSQIGLILALGNVFSVLLQPFMGDLGDRSKKLTVFNIMEGIGLILAALMILLFVQKKNGPALALTYLLAIGWIRVLEPFCNALSGKLEEKGAKINFGACRSMGSLCYAILTATLGYLVEKLGVQVLPVSGALVSLSFLVAVILVSKTYNKSFGSLRAEKREKERVGGTKEITLKDFIKRHPMFLLLSLGILGLFYGNNTVNIYMAQIASAVGGDSSDTGRIFSLLAFMEIPTMLLFSKINSKFPCRKLMKFSAAAFVLWIGCCTLARSVTSLLAAQIFQAFGFALFLPAVVKFIGDTMERGEAIKGQTTFTAVATTGGIFASLLGGIMLDLGGAKLLTAFGTVITIVGALMVILYVDRAEKEGLSYGSE